MDSHERGVLLERNAARYRTELTEMQLTVYLDDLAAYDLPTLTAAFAWCARQGGKFFPTVPELENAIRQMALASGEVMDGATAWAAFSGRVLGRYSFGVTRVFDWPDELTRTIVREQLGFDSAAVHNLAMLEKEYDRDKYRKQFIALYDEQRTLGAVQATVAQLPAANVRRIGGGA